MHIQKIVSTLTICVISLICSSSLLAQSDNLLILDISKGFFGTGDAGASSIGVFYNRRIGGNNLYLQGGYIKSSGTTHSQPFDTQEHIDNITNGFFQGGDRPVQGIAVYNSYSLGFTYRMLAKNKQSVYMTAGGSYKKYRFNNNDRFISRGAVFLENVELQSTNFYSNSGLGLHISLRYIYALSDNFGVGFHLLTEPTGDLLTNVGITLSSNF